MASILVTGASGVLGRELVPALRQKGDTVRTISRAPAAQKDSGAMHADLAANTGLDAALTGIHTVVHCATAGALKGQEDVLAMRNLLAASRRAGVAHFVYVSIVGIDRLTWFPYYEAKLACEHLLIDSGIPWTLQRATQFYELAAVFLSRMVQGPFLITPPGAHLQPVETKAVAITLADAACGAAQGRLVDVAGPEIRSFRSLAGPWLRATGKRRLIVPLPVPGTYFRLLGSNLLYNPQCRPIGIGWEQWLETHDAEASYYKS